MNSTRRSFLTQIGIAGIGAGGAVESWRDTGGLRCASARYIATPHHDSVTCAFDGDRIAVSFLSSIAKLNGREKETRRSLQGRLAG